MLALPRGRFRLNTQAGENSWWQREVIVGYNMHSTSKPIGLNDRLCVWDVMSSDLHEVWQLNNRTDFIKILTFALFLFLREDTA
jgi:hypothetical protein